jgi:glycosyltransferase involved in cell wall biosynthesis
VQPQAFAERHGIRAPYLLYSGRREPMKGTPLLTGYVDCFRKRTGRDIKLVFTGSGEIEAPVELEPHMVDVGYVTEQEKREAMAGALAFCHPSPNESLGIVLLESWLAGRPALVTAASDVLVYQCRKSNGGLWFRNYPEFEEELLLLIDRPDLADAMGNAGRVYVQTEYAWDAVDRRLQAALSELL